MSPEATLIQRLEALEQQVAALAAKETSPPLRRRWLDRVRGTQKDEPGFEEVLKLGKALRRSDGATKSL